MDKLTVILPQILDADERAQSAIDTCYGSLTEGDGDGSGYDDGLFYGYNTARRDGDGSGHGYGRSWGDGYSRTGL